MVANTEPEETAPFCKGLVELGCLVTVMAAGGTSSGWPDRLVIHRAWAGFIEFKGPRTRVRKNQELTMRECMRRGFPAVVVRFCRKTVSGQTYRWGQIEIEGCTGPNLAATGCESIDFDGTPGSCLLILRERFAKS